MNKKLFVYFLHFTGRKKIKLIKKIHLKINAKDQLEDIRLMKNPISSTLFFF